MPVVRSSNKRVIYRITEFDLLRQPVRQGNMYYCTDSRRMYEDINNLPNGRKVFACVIVSTEHERLYTVRPVNGTYYYIYETNQLFLYNGGWNIIIGSQVYNKFNINYEVPTGLSYVEGTVDGNGLLGDGSVVVRDANKLIKGKVYIDATDNTMVFTSFLGGGIRFLPSGAIDEKGSLSIREGQFKFYGDQFQVAATVISNKDMYVQKEKSDGEHVYKVYTEEDFIVGCWELNGYQIVDKLNAIEQPINLNVLKLNGHTSDYFSKVGHKHVSSDITDLTQFIKDNRYRAFMNSYHRGITINYDSQDNVGTYTLVANPFSLSFVDGATGYATVNNLTDTEISLTVDPDKHKHKATDLTDWNSQVNNFNNTYLSISKFNEEVVSAAKPNKILRLNSDARLPADITGNSETTTKLRFGREIKFIDGIKGSFIFDGTKDLDVSIIVDPNKHNHEQYVKNEDIGVKVPPLDSDKLIPLSYLPSEVKSSMRYRGNYTPKSNGSYPSSNPSSGDYWVVNSSGKIGDYDVSKGDMIIYEGGEWRVIKSSGAVSSVNRKTGDVTINFQDIISSDPDSVYNPSKPQEGKLVLTELNPYDNSKYYVNVTAKEALQLAKPLKIQFISDGVTNNVSSDEVYELSSGEEVTYIKLKADMKSTDINIDDGNINEIRILNASDFSYSVSSGTLTESKVRTLSNAVAYDLDLTQYNQSVISVDSDQLQSINNAITSKILGSYNITLNIESGEFKTISVTLTT